ncbi:MAG: chloramphenicol acetyltransferase [Bacteroidota bacterium]
MKQKLDIETWERREHFKLFNQFEEPFYGVCVNVDCTEAYRRAKEKKVSFFLYYLYKALGAAQLVAPFRYGIEGDEVFIYDQIDAGLTIARPNGTFGYGLILYHPNFDQYMLGAMKEVEQVQSTTDLARTAATNIIRFSALPWINFTSVSHARMFSVKDSIPRISFGKMTVMDGKRNMPLSIHVHHALVDGLHVGQYIDCFQQLMNEGV